MSEPGYQNEQYSGPYPSETSPTDRAQMSPPRQVTIAFWLYIAAAALSIVSLIISLTNLGPARESAQRQLEASGQPVSGSTLDAIMTGGMIFGAVIVIFWVAVYVLFAFFMRRGANWARWILTILSALSLLNLIGGIGIGALQALVAIVAAVLMWLHPSSEYFHAVKQRKQAGYR